MDFSPEEKLFRAVLPKDMLTKGNGMISSSAFKQSTGVSVDRQAGRADSDCINFMKEHISNKYLEQDGGIVSITCGQCYSFELDVVYKPLTENEYHSEIHNKSEEPLKITSSKARKLAKSCIIEAIFGGETSFTFSTEGHSNRT